jgi:hypothetical protein
MMRFKGRKGWKRFAQKSQMAGLGYEGSNHLNPAIGSKTKEGLRNTKTTQETQKYSNPLFL